MITNFNFQTSNKVIFGIDCIQLLPEIIRKFGKKVLVFRSKSVEIETNRLVEPHKIETFSVDVLGEPSIELLKEYSTMAKRFRPDCIVGMGGGSVIDTAKAVSAFINNQEEITDYFEIVGQGLPINDKTCPVIALPTTAGTGSEVTKNAVINFPDKKLKVSLRSEHLLPRIALIDPRLTQTLSQQITAGTGMDALTQLIEPFISNKANELTDIFCYEGIERISKSFVKVLNNGNDLELRCNMSFASLLSGMALANAGLGAVHGFAGVIGGMFDAPHGLLCARLLPAVLKENYLRLKHDAKNNNVLRKMEIISKLLIGKEHVKIENGIKWLFDLIEQIQIPRLHEFGLEKEDFPVIVSHAKTSSSMKGNPIQLPDESLNEILETSF